MMIKNNLISILIGGGTLLYSSCEIINPEEISPAYIYIDNFTVTSSIESQGYPSSKITDGWVYINGIFVGAYELPASVPVLTEGETDIIVYAGIKENGISGVSMIYPFYNAYSLTRTLTAGATDTLHPSCTYKPSSGIQFDMLERFESSNAFEGVETEVTLGTTTDPELVFEGNRSAIASFIPDADTFHVASSEPIAFPGADKQMFLELDYKAGMSFNVWLKCNTSGQPVYDEVLTITEKDYWNKIYVNLNPSLQFFAQYSPETIQLEFRAVNGDNDTSSILFDNIKIIRTK